MFAEAAVPGCGRSGSLGSRLAEGDQNPRTDRARRSMMPTQNESLSAESGKRTPADTSCVGGVRAPGCASKDFWTTKAARVATLSLFRQPASDEVRAPPVHDQSRRKYYMSALTSNISQSMHSLRSFSAKARPIDRAHAHVSHLEIRPTRSQCRVSR